MTVALKPDEQYMREALKEAEEALASRDRPIGAVIVNQGQIIAKAHQQVRLLRDVDHGLRHLVRLQGIGRLGDRDDGRMRGRIPQEPNLMVRPGDDLALVDDHRTDGPVAGRERLLGFLERFAHVLLVRFWGNVHRLSLF